MAFGNEHLFNFFVVTHHEHETMQVNVVDKTLQPRASSSPSAPLAKHRLQFIP